MSDETPAAEPVEPAANPSPFDPDNAEPYDRHTRVTPEELHRICPRDQEWADHENEIHPNRRWRAVPCRLVGARHPICDGHTRPGEPCEMFPRQFSTVCKMHGGNAPRAREMENRRRNTAKAEALMARFARPRDVDPQTAMAETLQSKAGQVMYLRALVNNLDQGGLKQVDKSGQFERPSVWVEMLWRVEKDLAEICRMMIDVGFAERQARYVDAQALMLVAGLGWLRKELGHGDDPRWEEAERAMLMSLAQGMAPGNRPPEGRRIIEGQAA